MLGVMYSFQRTQKKGKDVLVWMAERGSKTRKGMEGSHQRQFNPKIFATGTERCPVRYFKLYESHCPEKAKSPNYPFFLVLNHRGWLEKPDGWYKLSPLGKNQIGQFLRKTAQKAGLQACGKKIANRTRSDKQASRVYLMVLQKIS